MTRMAETPPWTSLTHPVGHYEQRPPRGGDWERCSASHARKRLGGSALASMRAGAIVRSDSGWSYRYVHPGGAENE